MNPLADTVCAMVAARFLNAVSVGFMPLAAQPILDEDGDWTGVEFISQELLELSVVPVPANPGALQLAKSFALCADDRRRLFGDDALEPGGSRSEPRIAHEQARNRTTLARLKRVF
jgi:phage head maturation protease